MTAGNYAGMAAAAALAVALTGCISERPFTYRTPATTSLQERVLEQVRLEPDGLRSRHQAPDGRSVEKRYARESDRCVQSNIAPRMPPGSGLYGLGAPSTVRVFEVPGVRQPIEKTLHYTMTGPRSAMACTYIEIQVPPNYPLSGPNAPARPLYDLR